MLPIGDKAMINMGLRNSYVWKDSLEPSTCVNNSVFPMYQVVIDRLYREFYTQYQGFLKKFRRPILVDLTK